jgi:hypothetical protein
MTADHPAWPMAAPAAREPRPDRTVIAKATPRVLVVSLVAGAVFDLAVRSGIAGVGGALAVLIAAAGLVVTSRPANRQAWSVAAAAPLFGVWLAVRTSAWLLPLDVLAAGGLLVLAATLARGGSVTDLGLGQLVTRGAHAAWHISAGPAYLRGAAGGRERALLSGLALALPVVVILGLLLSSADAVFASFFDWVSLPVHVLLIAVGTWAMAGLLRVAAARPAGEPRPASRRLGEVEGLVVLGAVSVVLLAFAAAQLIALSEGGRRVIETAGLTYADYARSGFFQLLAVAALTVGLLLAVHTWIQGQSTWLLVLSEVTVALTLALVVVSYRRLDLYVDAFGLTMLRLFVSFFTVWVGVALILLATRLGGVGRGRNWFGPACAGVGLLILFVLNVLNPEAVVMRHNLARGEFDAYYASQLSDDAVPTIAAALDSLTADERRGLRSDICPSHQRPQPSGWAAFNLATARARAARDDTCAA